MEHPDDVKIPIEAGKVNGGDFLIDHLRAFVAFGKKKPSIQIILAVLVVQVM